MFLANPEGLSDAAWVEGWSQLISLSPHIVPVSAHGISTPLLLSSWCHFLQSHPNQNLVYLFLQGISEGFKVGYNYQESHLRLARKNLMEAQTRPNVVDEYLLNEISSGRMVGPNPTKALPEIHVSRFGVKPNCKNHQTNKWKLILVATV